MNYSELLGYVEEENNVVYLNKNTHYIGGQQLEEEIDDRILKTDLNVTMKMSSPSVYSVYVCTCVC